MFIRQVVEHGCVSMECINLKGVPRILVLWYVNALDETLEISLNIMQSSLTPQETTTVVP